MNTDRNLPPYVLQLFGMVLVGGGAVYWAVTGNQSSMFVGAGVLLLTGGSGRRIQEIVRYIRDDKDS